MRGWAIAVTMMLVSVQASVAENVSPASTDVAPQIAALVAQSWSCQPRKTCGKIGSCEEAEYYLYNCAWGGKLDGDGDGAPCEKLCGSNN